MQLISEQNYSILKLFLIIFKKLLKKIKKLMGKLEILVVKADNALINEAGKTLSLPDSVIRF
jgi:hypothetical protein